jgi:outer membrane protein assembly factor BamB
MVFVGCSSNDGGQPQPTFQGFLSRLDADTGHVIWKRKMSPDNFGQGGGYSGVGVWGSSPAIDYSRNTVYCTTGNNYELPQSVLNCINNDAVSDKKSCMDPTNYVDSIVAINIDNGQVRWAKNFNGVDYWNIKLCPNHDSCGPYYKDYDFAQGPMLFNANGVDVVGAGDKGGVFYAVNRDNGQLIWSRRTGQGTSGGGMLHGSTIDDRHVYVGDTNNWGNPTTLKDGSVCAGYQGYWSALEKNTGAIVWQKCNPTGYKAFGPLTSAPGGLMFAGSIDPNGNLFALRSTDGAIVWNSQLGGSVGSGAALTGDYLIWGSGYSKWGIASPGNRLAAYKLGSGSGMPATPLPTSSYDTRGCWTCPAGETHWFMAGISTAPDGDGCACVPYSAPPPSTSTTSPTSYDTRGCWTCPAGETHWFMAGIASAPGGDRCACVPYSAPTPSTPSTSSPTSYNTRGCWTCPAGEIHWFMAGISTAPGGDRCACVPSGGSTPTTRAPSPTSYDTRGCWTCPAGETHWFMAGIASAPGGDSCACVPNNGSSTNPPCWTCPEGWKHWDELGMSQPGNGDKCQCIHE